MNQALLDRLQAGLAGRYAIERELGRGGMSTVYLARDLRHDRAVALKVLPPQLAWATGAERFLREIQVAAGLQHPHILTVHDSGETDGLLFYVMPFVEGESLRERLARERHFPLAVALRIARDVLSALEYAHGRGIVHRDVKPENILLSAGEAMVTDFGIARAIGVAAGDRLTGTGLAVGTPAYMSPEQVSGELELDGRSDVYSLGCVLFEMLAGEPPFSGGTALAVAAKRLTEPAPALPLLRDVPGAVERAVRRALALNPADRFPTAAAFAEALAAAEAGWFPGVRRWLFRTAAVTASAVLLAVGASRLVPPEARARLRTLVTRKATAMNPRRIVVAPFDNQTGDSAYAALGEMAAEWIAQGLVRTGTFEVVDPRTARVNARIIAEIPRVLRNADRGVALAEETGAGTVVTGTVYGYGDGLRIHAQITDIATGRLRGMEPVSGAASDPSALVALLARRVVGALVTTVDTTAVAMVRPPSYEAYREASLAWEEFLRDHDAEFYAGIERAVALDSTYVGALLLKAYALHEEFRWAETHAAVRRVAAHRDLLGPGELAGLDYFEAAVRGDLMAAARAAHRVLALAPGSAEVPLLASRADIMVNRPVEALDALSHTDPERGLNLINPSYWAGRTAALHQLGRHEEELVQARRALRQFPAPYAVHQLEERALAALGREEELADRLRHGRSDGPTVGGKTLARQRLILARELFAHGHEPAARRQLTALLSEPVTLAPDTNPATLQFQTELLYEAGRWGEALATATRLYQRNPRDIDVHGLLALAGARAGDGSLAGRMDALLAAARDPYLHGRHLLWRARLAAVEDDRDRAVLLLQAALAQGQPVATPWDLFLHTYPEFRALRDYPPFAAIIDAQR